MRGKPIGVFDSGIGGITILSRLIEYLPKENYIYFGDSLHNPYGDKTEEEILSLAIEASQFLINKGCKAIVVACNTASSVAIDYLREMFPQTIFIATLPALKVAMDENSQQNVLVMATKATLTSKKFQTLYHSYVKEHSHIYLLSCSNLANLIEEKVEMKINQKLMSLLTYYQDKNIQTVVLGCTHYPLIKKNIATFFGNAKLIDGSDGIKKELKRKLEERGLLNNQKFNGTLQVYNSKDKDHVERTLEILKIYKETSNFEK